MLTYYLADEEKKTVVKLIEYNKSLQSDACGPGITVFTVHNGGN